MQLSLWTYEGPPHVGAMRVANSMTDVHYVLHAPQGDTYADLLFTMIERNAQRPPVTYTTFQARDLGGDTAELLKRTLADAVERFRPEALLVGESCTAELIQDQPGAIARGSDLGGATLVPLELPSYSKKETWGAAETFYQLVRRVIAAASARATAEATTEEAATARGAAAEDATAEEDASGARRADGEGTGVGLASSSTSRRPRANLLGPTSLGFRCRDDVVEVRRLLEAVGVEVAVVAPMGASCAALARIPEADFNVCLYPEIAKPLCRWLERSFGQPTVATVPIGVGATRDFLREVGAIAGVDVEPFLAREAGRLPWYSRSVDSTYLTGKRVFVFGDGSHALAAARVATEELGFELVGLGSYARERAKELRAAAAALGLEALISDDYLEVERAIEALAPELVLGTQMERHVAKRLGIPCAVISAPVHVQDFPARYSPQMGFEGANVLFDTWVHPLMMGLEEHLLGMFRDDFEFNDAAGPSHRGGHASTAVAARAAPQPAAPASAVAEGHATATGDAEVPVAVPAGAIPGATSDVAPDRLPATDKAADEAVDGCRWSAEAERELGRIPFFVRGKARRNTEAFARERAIAVITLETLYDAKAHFGR